MEITVFELEARPGDQVTNRRADEDLAATGEGRHASSDVDGDTSDPVAGDLDLAGVDTGTDLNPERPHASDSGGRAPDGAAGTIEYREEAVACRIDLASSETSQLRSHEHVMAFEEFSPRAITGRAPVTNSWISPTSASWSPAHISSSAPGSSTYRAPGMWSAM